MICVIHAHPYPSGSRTNRAFANGMRATVLDHDPEQADLRRKFGYKVSYGDAARLDGEVKAMAAHTAEILWLRGEGDFLSQQYSRRHVLRFDGGVEVPGSSSPHVVPVPMSDPTAVDPEEAFVASIASCHMLWFLALAAKKGFCVDRYADAAVGVMGRNAAGKEFVSLVTLRPEVGFSGERVPSLEELLALHHRAHEECFIANSVRTEIRCEPVLAGP